MTPTELQRILDATLEDGRLTRTEKRAVRAVLEDWAPDADALARLRADVFGAARAALGRHRPEQVLEWVEDVLRLTLPEADSAATPTEAEAHFSPGEDCRRRICELLEGAERTVDICVFTITDNQIARAILHAHRRRVQVRVVTDDLKAEDRGSDIDALAQAGVPVRTDRTPAHMHHKFVIFDAHRLLSGSYNWTRSAFLENHENVLVTTDPRFVRPYAKAFEALWTGPDTGPHAPG